MKYKRFIIFILLFLPIMAFAGTVDPNIANLISIVFPKKSKEIIGILSFIVVLWTQLRAIIPSTYIAKLPKGVIMLLEIIAGNHRNATNAYHNDPIHIKTMNNIKQVTNNTYIDENNNTEIDSNGDK